MYDTLESISDNIDWFIEDLSWRYDKLGWEFVLLKFVPGSKLIFRISMDVCWAKEEAESLLQYVGDKKWPEVAYNIEAAQAEVAIYTEAYNKHKYFWMRKI